MDIIRIVFLLILLGCQATSPWNVSHLQGTDTSRLSCPTHDKVNGVGVEVVHAKNTLRTYLDVYSQTIPPYRGNDKEALVTLKTTDRVFRAVARRHAGGQRALLPAHLQQVLIDSLLEGHPVTIELQGYRSTLSPEQFSNKYDSIKKKSFNLPIQLPFKL